MPRIRENYFNNLVTSVPGTGKLFKAAPNLHIEDPEQLKLLLQNHAPDWCKIPKYAEKERTDETDEY